MWVDRVCALGNIRISYISQPQRDWTWLNRFSLGGPEKETYLRRTGDILTCDAEIHTETSQQLLDGQLGNFNFFFRRDHEVHIL